MAQSLSMASVVAMGSRRQQIGGRLGMPLDAGIVATVVAVGRRHRRDVHAVSASRAAAGACEGTEPPLYPGRFE